MNITTWLCLVIIVLLLLLIAAVVYNVKLSHLFFKLTNKNIRESVQSRFLERACQATKTKHLRTLPLNSVDFLIRTT
jgi:Tfp pilus assembly protein PilO